VIGVKKSTRLIPFQMNPTFCGLCLKNKPLQESHLIGSALVKQLRRSDGVSNPNPIVVTKSKTFITSKQVSSPFLCTDCEQLFSKSGETFISGQCFRRNGDFRLRDLLESSHPLMEEPNFKIFDGRQLLGSKVEKILYFAASIFWRSSSHRWKMGDSDVGKISLVGEYQEQFRLYLLGKSAFPTNARIFVHVSSEPEPDLTLVYPCTTRVDRVRRHKFYIPGLLFILFLGKSVPKQFDIGALNGLQHQCIWLCAWRDDSLFQGSLDLVKDSIPQKKLQRGRV